MPILTATEFENIIGSTAKQMTTGAHAFTHAEAGASDEVERLTGYAAPDDVDTAEQWAKDAVAYLVAQRLIGAIRNPSQGFISWVNKMAELARQTLADHKESTPTGRQGAEYSEIDGMITW